MTAELNTTAIEAVNSLAEKHGGAITPEIVLEEAKKKRSPLHKLFVWDDTEAAEKYRLIQAGCIIRRVKVTYVTRENQTIRVRAFVNVTPEHKDDEPESKSTPGREKGVYIGFMEAMNVPSYQDQIMAQCRRDSRAFREKYVSFEKAAKIIAAMDELFPVE